MPELTQLEKLKSCLWTLDKMLKEEIPSQKAILAPWLTEQSITLVSGVTGSGKTWFVSGVCQASCCGLDFGPWKAGEATTTLMIDGEMVTSMSQKRLRRLAWTEPPKKPFLFLNEGDCRKLKISTPNLSDVGWRSDLRQLCLDEGVGLLILDNISSLTPGTDEQEKKAWDPINQWGLELRFSGVSVIWVHHLGKKASAGPRGTSGRLDNIDTSIEIEKPSGHQIEDGIRFSYKFTKHRVPDFESLPLLAPGFFQLQAEGAELIWTYGKETRTQRRQDVLELLAEGCGRAEIAEKLGISPQAVGKQCKRLEEAKLVEKKGQGWKLTSRGEENLANEKET